MDFEHISSETIHHGRAFDVELAQVRLPDGKVRTYDLVRHTGAVTLVPLDDKGNVLFVRQFRVAAGRELLELPAGTLGRDENPDDCAARELREETGFAARSLVKLGELFLAPGYSTEYMHLYLASDLYPAPLEQDEDEYLNLVPIPVKEAYRMAREGEIHDAKSLAGLLLAQGRVGQIEG